MKTLHLKSNSYESFFAECEKAGVVFDGEIITSSHTHSLHLLPNLSIKTGNTLKDDDGNEYPETRKLEGFHANLKFTKATGIEHLAVSVKTPLVR